MYVYVYWKSAAFYIFCVLTMVSLVNYATCFYKNKKAELDK